MTSVFGQTDKNNYSAGLSPSMNWHPEQGSSNIYVMMLRKSENVATVRACVTRGQALLLLAFIGVFNMRIFMIGEIFQGKIEIGDRHFTL